MYMFVHMSILRLFLTVKSRFYKALIFCQSSISYNSKNFLKLQKITFIVCVCSCKQAHVRVYTHICHCACRGQCLVGISSSLLPNWKAPFLSFSPNPALSVDLQQKKEPNSPPPKKPTQFCILGGYYSFLP